MFPTVLYILHLIYHPLETEDSFIYIMTGCENVRCKTCPAIGNVGNFTLVNTPCKTSGVVYMIRCGVWDIKYVGQTSLALNLRVNNHRSLCNNNVFDNNKFNSSKFEYEHFKIHSFNKAFIDILCIEPDHDRRLELENKYIVDFKTAYPYGLNDRINNISVSSVKDKLCIYQSFFNDNPMSTPKTNRVRSKNRNNRYLDMNKFLYDICINCFKKPNFVKYVKGLILGLSRRKAKVLIPILKDFKFSDSQVKDLIIDLVKFKTGKLDIDDDPFSFESYLVVDFSHKYLDLLDIPQILHNEELVNTFPRKETYPKISFRYSPTLGSVSFNYAKFSKNLLAEDINDYPWYCYNSEFKDNTLNHVVTGSLEILEDPDLIAIFRYGSKFRLTPRFDIDEIKKEIRNSVNEYVDRLSYRLHIHSGYFSEWKTLFLDLVNRKILHTVNIYPSTINNTVFKNKLQSIHDKYVIMPVDKAGNNFGFICKKFYAEVLHSEIVNSDTFELSTHDYDNVKNTCYEFLKKYKIIPSTFDIPFMYVIPKFHKNPTKFRFITSSVNCITKDISILLNLILNELYNRVELESESSWIIRNNKRVLESLEECNANPGLPGNHMITSFDFSTLYTALPHGDLIRCLVALYSKYFTGDVGIKFKSKKLNISKVDFVDILKFCIRNSYISFDNKIFRQIKGIPMGSNYSPNAATLYLHFYEVKFINLNPVAGRVRYDNWFRFIDDLLWVNNRDSLFDISSIYPRELQISNTNSEPHKKCSFLDISIEIVDGVFIHKIYDKRRDFNFDILGLPSFKSNVPTKLVYGVMCSQFCRFAAVCKYRDDFIFNCKLLVSKLEDNGCPSFVLRKFVNKFKYSKKLTLSKYGLDFDLTNCIFT